MRILYISYAKYGGGNWIHTTQFLRSMRAIHDDIIGYTPRAQKESAGKQKKKDETSDSKPDPLREIRYLISGLIRRIVPEAKQLLQHKPDIVVLRRDRYTSSVFLCLLMKRPIILEDNGPIVVEDKLMPSEYRLRGAHFWNWYELRILNLATHVFVVSETLRQYYIHKGLAPQKITTVPNGVDIQQFNVSISGVRVREKYGLQGNVVVGFSGSFTSWHGLDFLLENMKTFFSREDNLKHNSRLLLIGKAFSYFSMPDIPQENIVTTGYVGYEEMPEYLAALDIVIAPYPLIEPFYFSPLKLFEAMSMGKTVLASAQGQITEIIEDGYNGSLYPPEDSKIFLKKLKTLIMDESLRCRLGKEARETIEQKYTWKHNASKILDLCQRHAPKNPHGD